MYWSESRTSLVRLCNYNCITIIITITLLTACSEAFYDISFVHLMAWPFRTLKTSNVFQRKFCAFIWDFQTALPLPGHFRMPVSQYLVLCAWWKHCVFISGIDIAKKSSPFGHCQSARFCCVFATFAVAGERACVTLWTGSFTFNASTSFPRLLIVSLCFP